MFVAEIIELFFRSLLWITKKAKKRFKTLKYGHLNLPRNIRPLKPTEWQMWKNLRLESLQINPESFATTWEEESRRSNEDFEKDVTDSIVFGAFLDGQLVGCIGLSPSSSPRKKHLGYVFGLYVKPAYQRKGIADALITHLITYAHNRFMYLRLSCMTDSKAAYKLYLNHGFKSYGTEFHAFQTDDEFYHLHLMELKFSPS